MPSIKQHIAKGFYQYSQLNSFVSVKNYIFTRVNNKKCLLIRFSNDMEYAVNSMIFTVVQYNGAGKIITKKKIVYDGISFGAGTTYVAPNGIIVAEECRDFKIYFNTVRSGKYKYVVKNGEVLVLYDQAPPRANKNNKNKKKSRNSVFVRKIGTKKLRWSLTIAIAALAAILALSFFSFLSEYREDNELAFGSSSNVGILSALADMPSDDSCSMHKSFRV